MTDTIKLGSTVRDRASGLMGIALVRTLLLNGMTHYTVQPSTLDPTKMPDAYDFSVNILEVLDDGISEHASPITDVNSIKLGDQCVDTASKFEGVVIERQEHFSGCVTFTLVTEMINGPDDVKTGRFDQARLEVIEEGIIENAELAERGSFRTKIAR